MRISKCLFHDTVFRFQLYSGNYRMLELGQLQAFQSITFIFEQRNGSDYTLIYATS